jgi:stage II sporulation protein D
MLLLLLASAACGKHKAQVKIPKPQQATKSSTPKTDPPKTTVPIKPPAQRRDAPQDTPQVKAPSKLDSSTPLLESRTDAGPMIRIGLKTDAKELHISASDDFFVMEKIPEASRQSIRGEIEVRIERESENPSVIYKIQIASFAKIDKAQEFLDRISEKFTVPIVIHENPSNGAKQIRVGEYSSKEDAEEYLGVLKKSGYSDAFLVREETSGGSGELAIAIRGADNLFKISSAGFLFMPSSSKAFLSVEGKAYRGSFDLFKNKNGRITLVNQLGMEDYLLGVVPSEMSPSTYPEFEALAAQSIAARTYALKNMGRYRTEGFDLSDDTRTQVYNGVSIEKAAATDAVHKTAGIAIYYQGKLIDAMFMSTCGGHTEDFSNVYDAQPVPYLKGVRCAIESGPEKNAISIEGKHALSEPFTTDDGSLANRNIELAQILKLLPSGSELSTAFLSDSINQEEAAHLVKAAVAMIQKSPHRENLSTKGIDTRAGFLRYAAEAFYGIDEIKRKISENDAAYYMASLKDGDNIPPQLRAPLSYLMQKGLWHPSADNTAIPDAPMRRGDAISLMIRWIEAAKPEILRKGAFAEAGSSDNHDIKIPSIKIKGGNKTREFALAASPSLFRLDSGRSVPIGSLQLIGTEKASFHINAEGMIDFLEIELSPAGTASDRYSPSATWETTLTKSAVADKLRNLAGNLGELNDLKPFRIGTSGRAVQIQAIGSRKSIVLNGYKVRGALGLRDTLFTITREFNPDGSVASFTFSGSGSGHGVGLCQVGAYGMAKAGQSYEEILKTYYLGVEIKKAY